MATGRRLRVVVSGRRGRPGSDGGFTLLELVVSLAVLTVVLSSVTVFFVRSTSVTREQGQRQSATRVAASAIEWVHATKPTVFADPVPNGPNPPNVWKPGTSKYFGDTEAKAATAAWVPPVSAEAAAAVTLAGLTYVKHWYAGECWRTGTTSDCTAENKAAGRASLLRVVVAVTWRDAECPGNECTYVSATLVSGQDDPVFVVPTPPTPPPAPPPIPLAVWANLSTSSLHPAALLIQGSSINITGLVHSNTDLVINGSSINASPRLEYGTSQTVSASGSSLPTPVRVSAGPPPFQRNVVDYEPGGSAARAAGSGYYAVPPGQCTSGQWTYTAAVPASATVVYVPCAVTVLTNVRGLLVAEGRITISLPSVTVGDSSNPKAGGLLSNSNLWPAIELSGSSARVYGNIQAIEGKVRLRGSLSVFRCGIIGDIVLVEASDITITSDSSCV